MSTSALVVPPFARIVEPKVIKVASGNRPKVIKVVLGAPGSSGAPGTFFYESVAELRASTRHFSDGDFIQLESWHPGLRLGGGYFQHDAADTTSVDDSGLIIVDARGQRWKRRIDTSQTISPTMFGAKGQRGVDDTAALNATMNALRASADPAVGMHTLHIADEALVFDADGSVNATAIVANTFNFRFGPLAINSRAAGKIGFDLTGSQFYNAYLTLRGDPNARPSVGVFQGRIEGFPLPHPTADRGHIVQLVVFGEFTKAGYINIASETHRIDFLIVSNSYWRSNACCRIMAGASAVVENFCGMPTSEFQTIGLDDPSGAGQSLSSISIGQAIDQRSPAYNYAVTVSKSNPAVVTFNPADMAAGMADFGLANGARVHLITVGDGLGVNNWAHQSNLVWPVANLNAATHTLELPGLDTSAVTDNLVSAFIKNDGGAAVVLGHLGMYREFNGYTTCFGTKKYLLDTRTGPDGDRNWIIELAGRHELGTPHLMEILGDDKPRFIRGLKIKSDNENSVKSPILVTDTGVAGTGDVRVSNFELELGHNSQSPERLFTTPRPGYFSILGGRVVTVLNSLTATVDPNEEDFGEGVFDLVRPGVVPRIRHLGDREATGTWNFLKKLSNTVSLRAKCTEDSALAGPLVDLGRSRSVALIGVTKSATPTLRISPVDMATAVLSGSLFDGATVRVTLIGDDLLGLGADRWEHESGRLIAVSNLDEAAGTFGSLFGFDTSAIADNFILGAVTFASQAGDRIGRLRFVGSDSLANDTSYAYLYSEIVTATDGAEEGAAGFNALVGAVDTQIIRMSKFGLQGGMRSQTLATDAAFTLVVASSPVQTFHTGTLTADRAVTLSTVTAYHGARFRISRSGGGAFNLNIGTTPAKALASGTWCEVVYDGTIWKVSQAGSL
jgi:hypothetical protein